MTRVNKTMLPKIKDSVRQMNMFSVDTYGYIASISFSNDDIKQTCTNALFSFLIYSNSKTYTSDLPSL